MTQGAEWKESLANALIWIDYTSIPQPSAADEEVVEEKEEPGIQDHRLITSDAGSTKAKLIEQLVAAVDSIPSYIERCTQMWVLVPATEHSNVPGATCDFFSWRKRGWCRMEFAASKLARGDDMPIVVIESEANVYYLNPCDSARLCAAMGDFTVEDDAHKVNGTLSKMLDAKTEYFYDEGDITLARELSIFRPNFVSLPQEEKPTDGTEALEAMKARFKWRDEKTEAAWMKKTGWTLLTLAAATDDLAAVKHLLAQPGVTPAYVETPIKNFKKDTPLRKQPFSQYIGGAFDECTAMAAACTWATPPVVEALLEAGGVADMNAACGFHPCHCTGAVMSGKKDILKFLLDKDPELATQRNPKVFGLRALHYACEYSGEDTAEIVKMLLEAGAAETINTPDDFGNAPVHTLVNPDYRKPPSKELLELLKDHGAELDKPLDGMGTSLRRLLPVIKMLAAMGVTQANGLTRLLQNHIAANKRGGAKTALQISAERGDTMTVEALVKLNGLPSVENLRDQDGLTPIEKLYITHPNTSAPNNIAKVLGPKAGPQSPASKLGLHSWL